MESDDTVKEALLKDPRVQEQLRKRGEDALSDPAVQQKIISICQDRFPDVAEQVAQNVAEWADDPEVQRKVRDAAKQTLFTGPSRVLALIEQGPSGVRVLAFGGGVASAALAFLSMLNIIQQIAHPIDWIIDSYQLMFSLTTMLFEANPDTIQSVGVLTRWYDYAIKWAPFLTTALGRGLFMVFQGTLWIRESNLTDIPSIAVGTYMIFVGGVLVALHWGVMPMHVAESIRDGTNSARRMVRRTLIAVSGDEAGGDPRRRGAPATGSEPSSPSQVEMQSVHDNSREQISAANDEV